MTDRRIREFRNITLRFLHTWAFTAGGFSAALGLVVMVGWHAHSAALIQLNPTLVPMQYNTAIGFLLSGLMLLAHGRDFRAAELTFAVMVAIIGLLTLLEYIVGADLRIDQLLMQHYITVETSHPGRMAPNTALCFSLTGIAIVLSAGTLRNFSSLINATSGSLILGLGIVALLGYMLDLEAAYGWGRLTRMAPHTAFGFIVIGSGLLAIGWKSARADDKSLPPWLPVPAAIAVLSVTFSLWQALHPERDIVAIQQSQDLVLFFGIVLAAVLAFAVSKVVSESASRRQLEIQVAKRKQTQEMLGERVKELQGLHSLLNIFNESGFSLEGALEKAVAIIPPAWQYPDITCARITLHEHTYVTSNFATAEWRQTSDIVAASELVGELEVGYLQEMPIMDEGPFLKEERDLINQMADVIGRYVHRRRMEHQLFQAQKMEAVGQLTGGIAHDFNNLLGVIMGNIELVKDSIEESNPESIECLDDALESTRRGAALTSQLLAFSRKQMLDPELVDISRLIHDMHDLLQRSLGETIKIETIGAGGLWSCFIDKSQFENALLNLALNARDAMPEGGNMTIETANVYLDDAYVETQVELTEGQYVMLAVSDTGTGMSQETREHALEPFYTTKDAGRGTGMGLSMIHGFAKQSKGHVNIYSELGHGTTIKLYLPRYMGEAQARITTKISSSIRGGDETILVVEDNPALLKLLTTQLHSLGYSVLSATNGDVALEVFTANPDIALLLSDVILPGGLSGRDVAAQIRQRQPDMKVLFMSGYTKNAIIHHGQLDSDALLLKKPFTKIDLAKKLRSVLDQ